MLAEEVLELSILDGPEATLGRIEQSMVQLLESKSLTDRRIAGVGVSVPAPVDPHTGRPSEPPMMQGWDGYPIAEHFVERFPGRSPWKTTQMSSPSVSTPWSTRTATALCLIQVSTGIGFGIVIDGRIYTGSDGGAGDIGHVRAYGDCGCPVPMRFSRLPGRCRGRQGSRRSADRASASRPSPGETSADSSRPGRQTPSR